MGVTFIVMVNFMLGMGCLLMTTLNAVFGLLDELFDLGRPEELKKREEAEGESI